MPWMKVTVVDAGKQIDNVVNTDHIVRFSPVGDEGDGGTLLRFVDGTSIFVTDLIEEITQVVLKADEKKK